VEDAGAGADFFAKAFGTGSFFSGAFFTGVFVTDAFFDLGWVAVVLLVGAFRAR
jgi:hypothetical protein